jgi:DNA-binding response OmpR family regulator
MTYGPLQALIDPESFAGCAGTPDSAAPELDRSELSPTESKIWGYLVEHCGALISTTVLAREALGRDDEKASILVRQCIFHIRRLLGPNRSLLQHTRGLGYRLAPIRL